MLIQMDLRCIFQYILIYFAISAGGSAWSSFMGNNNYVIFIFLLSAGTLFFMTKGVLNRRFGITIILCTIFCFLTMCYSTLSIGTYLNFMGKIILAYVAVIIDKEQFRFRFVKLASFLTIISCGIYFLIQIVGFESFSPLFSLLYTNPADGDYQFGNGYGLLFYRFVPLHASRNCGLFTEPGEHAIFLLAALFVLIAYYEEFNENKRDKIFLLLSLAVVTTQSTSGYIMFAIVIVFALISKKITVFYSYKLWFIVISCVCLFRNYFIAMYNYTITNKVINEGVLDLNQGTAAARSGSITGIFNHIIDNPISILGMGFEGIQKNGLDGCAGLLAVLLAVGLPAFLVLIWYLFSEGNYNFNSRSLLILAICILVISGLSQPGTGFPVCYMIFFSGSFKDYAYGEDDIVSEEYE